MIQSILTLQITREVSGGYIARLNDAIAEPGAYRSIEEAILIEAAAVPEDFAHFMEVRYCGFSSGTELIDALPAKASGITDRLMGLVAESHRLGN